MRTFDRACVFLQETSDFRAGAADQPAEARFGAPTAIAKKISGQETV